MKKTASKSRGVIVDPVRRLSKKQVELIDRTSKEILGEIGLAVTEREAIELFEKAGASVKKSENGHRVRLPAKLVEKALADAPSEFRLGARDPSFNLTLSCKEPRVHFGTGSETNWWLEAHFNNGKVAYSNRRGTTEDLMAAAKLADHLETLDIFLRPVNIQDEEITESNKDVNKFYCSLAGGRKHVMAGFTDENAIAEVKKMAVMIAGDEDNFAQWPLVSGISCVTKSPLTMVDDAARKLIAAARAGIPMVVSSSPQGGSTAPIEEAGMLSLIHAELLAGLALGQLAAPGAKLLYGAVPVRARLDNLHDLYGAPEFIHYAIDCVQMAEYTGVPCYASAGVGDSKVPGIQTTVEKLPSQLAVAQAGPAFIHYAYGLLDRTSIFSPLQAVLDDAQIAVVKDIVRTPYVDNEICESVKNQIGRVMDSNMKLFARFIRKPLKEGRVSKPYEFEGTGDADDVMELAQAKLDKLMETGVPEIPPDVNKSIFENISGILPKLNTAKGR